MTSTWKPSTEKPTGGQSPILDVNWTLESWVPEERTFGQGTQTERKSMSIKFNFKDLEILAAREPYPFPIASISVSYQDPHAQGNRGATRWEALSSSGRMVFGGTFDLDDLVGKRQRWAQKDFKIRQPLTNDDGTPLMEKDPRNPEAERQAWGDVDSECWQIVSVEGVGTGTVGESANEIFDYMAGKANNLDENAFYQALIQDQRVTRNQEVVLQITQRRLVASLVAMGKISRDEQGILHSGAVVDGVSAPF